MTIKESIFTQDQQAIIECVESRPWAYSNESAGRGYFNPSKRRGKKIQESWAVRLRSLMSNIDEICVVYAVHEAGHAVVTVALGVRLEQVTINNNSPKGGGYSQPDFFMYKLVASNDLDFMPKKELRQIIEKRIVMAMAGRIAELKILNESRIATEDGDDVNIKHALDLMEIDDKQREMIIKKCKRRTRRLVSANIENICRVVDALWEDDTLSGRDVISMMRGPKWINR
jgi:ATP-dependent Zn protease